jgi:hypothetical protein
VRPEEQAGDAIRVTLSDILEDIGVDNARLLMAPGPENEQVRVTVIVDPEDGAAVEPGALVFLVGARGRASLPKVRALLADQPVAIAIKGSEADLAAVREVMNGTRTGLIAVAAEARWDQLEGIAIDRLRESLPSGDTSTLMQRDLFGIAQTTATLTRGHVVIEDTANRVLAYSPASNDVDELRRLSILARRGPERYQKLLKESGVYKHLQGGEVPIHIPANPEEGLRERVAIAIFAGRRILGYIWLQEGTERLAANTDRIMVGSARHAAIELVRYRNEQSQSMRRDRVSSLLSGTAQIHSQAQSAGLDPSRPAALVLVSSGSLHQSAPGR